MGMQTPVMVGLAGVLALGCGADESSSLQSAGLSGDWSGEWTLSLQQVPPQTQVVALDIAQTLVTGGRIREADFTVENRDVLFDDRQNGVVYSEGDGLFRTNLSLPDRTLWSLGFVTDEADERALIGDFFSRVGAIQRIDTIPSSTVTPRLEGRWSGRFAALDNPNPDDAEVETGVLSLDCSALVCSASGTRTFTIRFRERQTSAWTGTVEGLIAADALIKVLAVPSPDGQMLAVAACAGINDWPDTGLFCLYAALSSQTNR